MGFCGPKIQYQKMHLQMQQKMQIHLRHVLLAHRFLPASWCGFSYWLADAGSPIGQLNEVLLLDHWLGFFSLPVDWGSPIGLLISHIGLQLIQVHFFASWFRFSYWPADPSSPIGQMNLALLLVRWWNLFLLPDYLASPVVQLFLIF